MLWMIVTLKANGATGIDHANDGHVDNRRILQKSGLRTTLEKTVENLLRWVDVLRRHKTLCCPTFLTSGLMATRM